jgi:UDP-3-O-acyl-N-acetylglucosamine deacetylase
MLCGALLCGFTLVAIKSGHALDVQLAQAIAQRLPFWQARMEEQYG